MSWGSVLGQVAGAIIGGNSTSSANSANIGMNYDFAKNGIQWRVEDAKKAGIHPLAALGAQTHSPSIGVMADTSVAQGVSAAAQSLAARKQNDLQSQLLEAQIQTQKAAAAKDAAEAEKIASDAALAKMPGYTLGQQIHKATIDKVVENAASQNAFNATRLSNLSGQLSEDWLGELGGQAIAPLAPDRLIYEPPTGSKKKYSEKYKEYYYDNSTSSPIRR